MLSFKLERFLSGTLQADQHLSPRALQKIGIRRPQLLKHILFEENISLDSGIVRRCGQVFFGRHSYMNAGGYLHGKVFVGRYCSIGRRVSIGAPTHSMTGLSTSPALAPRREDGDYTSEDYARIGARPPQHNGPTIIESDVWIGDGAIIFPSVKIGSGAVIGSNAIVRKDVAPYAIVAGVSSEPIRYRFAPEIISELLATRWWDLDYETITTLPIGNIMRMLPAISSAGRRPHACPSPTYSLSIWYKNLYNRLRKRRPPN